MTSNAQFLRITADIRSASMQTQKNPILEVFNLDLDDDWENVKLRLDEMKYLQNNANNMTIQKYFWIGELLAARYAKTSLKDIQIILDLNHNQTRLARRIYKIFIHVPNAMEHLESTTVYQLGRMTDDQANQLIKMAQEGFPIQPLGPEHYVPIGERAEPPKKNKTKKENRDPYKTPSPRAHPYQRKASTPRKSSTELRYPQEDPANPESPLFYCTPRYQEPLEQYQVHPREESPAQMSKFAESFWNSLPGSYHHTISVDPALIRLDNYVAPYVPEDDEEYIVPTHE
jgi:hypothetical protein